MKQTFTKTAQSTISRIDVVSSLLATVLCLGMLWAIAGCASDPNQGYALGTSKTFDPRIKTVYVPMFENTTFAKGIEFELTDAIVKEIQRTTPWRVTSSRAADAVLEGSITDTSLRRLSSQRESGLAQEQAETITVSFNFKNTRSGKTLVGREHFSASDSFIPANPVRERLEIAESGAIQRLARDIVAELQSNW